MKDETILVAGADQEELKSLAGLARAAVRSTIGTWMFSGQKGGRRALRRELRQKRDWFTRYAVRTARAKSIKSARRTWYSAVKKVANGMREACNVALDQLSLPGVE